jgi:hypothetical protein
MDADLRILFTVPLVVLLVVVLVVLLVVEGVFARGALNIIIEEEEEVVVGEDEDIPLLLLLFSSRSEERVRACSSEDIFVIFFLSLCLFVAFRFFGFCAFRFFTFFSWKRTFFQLKSHARVRKKKRALSLFLIKKLHFVTLYARKREKCVRDVYWSDDESAEAKNGSERFVGRDCE